MGCCVSTNNDSPASHKDQHFSMGSESKAMNESRAPPPSLLEEETVKEVLSETPNLKSSPFISSSQDEKKTQDPVLGKIQEDEDDDLKTEKKSPITSPISVTNTEDVASDVSEICSLSFSESVSTTTVTDSRREDEEEVRQQIGMRLRSPSKLPQLPAASNRVVGKSPTRRPEQSPCRRNGVGVGVGGGGSVRMVHGRDASQGIALRGPRPDPKARDPGESSGRRSRSPATSRSAMGRSPSARRTNRSPARVRSDPTESRSKKADDFNGNLEGKWPRSNVPAGNNNATASESLENPLVSLECFIFL